MSARRQIIAALSEDSMGGIATLHDVAHAEQLVDAVVAEALAEKGLLPKADVVTWLVKKAREDTPVWQLASKVERGAVRPNNLRMLPPDFFEPGHSYTHRDGSDFQCVAVTAHPVTGQRLAMGWRSENDEWHRPTVCNLGQWLHEYDGVQAPDGTEGEARA
jgi:hypothetical protein